jgi:hypothetical protein
MDLNAMFLPIGLKRIYYALPRLVKAYIVWSSGNCVLLNIKSSILFQSYLSFSAKIQSIKIDQLLN